jgi:hypothetical protein
MRRIKTHHWDPTIGQEATNRQDNEAAEPAGDTKDVVIKAEAADAVVAAAEVGKDAASHGQSLLPQDGIKVTSSHACLMTSVIKCEN